MKRRRRQRRSGSGLSQNRTGLVISSLMKPMSTSREEESKKSGSFLLPEEGHDLVYSRLTLPSYLNIGGDLQDGEEIVDQLIKFELGLTHEVNVPLRLEKEGVIGIDIEKLQKDLYEQLGVTASDDLSRFTCAGRLRMSEEFVAQKLLCFSRGAVPSVVPEEGSDLQPPPPPLVRTQSTNDEWTCSICLCILINPATLQCGHTCCKECLDPILSCGDVNKRFCPLCREHIPTSWKAVVNVEMQAKIEKMFHDDLEYQDRNLEVAEQVARNKGITIYNLPTHFFDDQLNKYKNGSFPNTLIDKARSRRCRANVELKQSMLTVLNSCEIMWQTWPKFVRRENAS